MGNEDKFLFTWRDIVRDKDFGPKLANTRFVLFSLSFFMNEHGNNCFPSIETLKDETRLSRPTIIKHLKLAIKEGWIKREYRGQGGQGWKLYKYIPVIPKDIVKMVKQLNHVGEGGKIQREGNQIESKRWLNRAKNVVKQLYPNTSYNTSKNTSCDEHVHPFSEGVSGSSENYIPSKEEFDALRQTLSPITNKKPKPSLDQRKAELRRQAEQIMSEDESPCTFKNLKIQWQG